MAPVRRMTHLMGICLFAIGYGLARTLVVFIVAAFMFDLDFSHANVAGALGVLVASTLPLIGLSILTAVCPCCRLRRASRCRSRCRAFCCWFRASTTP